MNPAADAVGGAKPFDQGLLERFQDLLDIHGDPALVEVKRRAWRALREGLAPEAFDGPRDRHGRAALRIALGQARSLGTAPPTLAKRRRAHDVVSASKASRDEQARQN